MGLISIIVLALAISLDGLVVGITYGLKKIEIDILPILIISFVSSAMFLIAISLGQGLTNFLSPEQATKVGGLLLIMIGSWLFYESLQQFIGSDNTFDEQLNSRELFSFRIESLGLIINILQEPIKADVDYSGIISKREAIALGIALALDAFGAGIGAGLTGYYPFLTTLFVFIFKFCLLNGGVYLGKTIELHKFNDKIILAPGIILILLGIIKVL